MKTFFFCSSPQKSNATTRKSKQHTFEKEKKNLVLVNMFKVKQINRCDNKSGVLECERKQNTQREKGNDSNGKQQQGRRSRRTYGRNFSMQTFRLKSRMKRIHSFFLHLIWNRSHGSKTSHSHSRTHPISSVCTLEFRNACRFLNDSTDERPKSCLLSHCKCCSHSRIYYIIRCL